MFALSATGLQRQKTFEQMKDTVKAMIGKYKIGKVRYGLIVFGDIAVGKVSNRKKTLFIYDMEF